MRSDKHRRANDYVPFRVLSSTFPFPSLTEFWGQRRRRRRLRRYLWHWGVGLIELRQGINQANCS